MEHNLNEIWQTKEYKYARALYIKMGQLLGYDPLYAIANSIERRKIENKIIDFNDLKDNRVTCTSWARLYDKCLKERGIWSSVETNGYHDWVEFTIKNVVIMADLCEFQKDIHGIKFGKQISGFRFKDSEETYDTQKTDREVNYYKGIYTDEVIEMIKEELLLNKQNKEDYQIKVFESLMLILNNYHEQLDFCSGTSFIHFYLKKMLLKDEGFETYNPETYDFRMYYPLIFEDQSLWYCYQKSLNGYKLLLVNNNDLGNYRLEEISSQSHIIYKLVKK